MRLNRGVVAMCAAQACAQIGAFGVAALLPTLIVGWSLSNTEAGWISGIYYAAYTLVVPLLSSLTDRVDPKRRADRGRLRRLRLGRHRLLVGARLPGADGRRLGRQLHAGT